ncbi:hypothetical protein CEXT_335311 [Caerostris extrusa]|uniref:Uncharacterized protein n=1 Tax=Caerostris extrusa TaxID=172846 RepID=A0AAV4NND1_CAEEX|nr:hypothetical protein CEXT_335311 [Caerostris extrusa]
MSGAHSDLIIAHSSHKGLLIVRIACTRLMKPPRFKELGRTQKDALSCPRIPFSAIEIRRRGEFLPRRLLGLIGRVPSQSLMHLLSQSWRNFLSEVLVRIEILKRILRD